MTIRELIMALLAYDLDRIVYVGKGMGPAQHLLADEDDNDEYLVILP